jgi:hypothetical protein
MGLPASTSRVAYLDIFPRRNPQIWRLVTPYFFYGGLGFPFLINMLFLYQYSRLLEEETFTGKPAEYVWMLLVCAGVLMPVGLLWPFPVLSISLLLAIVYVWSNLNKERTVSFFFGLRFKVWERFGSSCYSFGSRMIVRSLLVRSQYRLLFFYKANLPS